MNENTAKLNEEQVAAVTHGAGPLLVIAGAGTGKTTVVTERISFLIKEELAKPSEILALTFTEKASREMEARVDRVMPYGYTQMWILTFHSFCDRILRREALQVGLDPRYKLLSQAESTQLLRDNLFDLKLDYFRPLGNPTKFVDGMLAHFSRLQDEDISPIQYKEYVKKLALEKGKNEADLLEITKFRELASIYQAYDELKVKNGYMDFGDLIIKTLNLFRKRPNVLATYQEQFKYILVDEFQDTNFAQNELAILLAGKEANITATGDDDQSIYRFRGAAVSNIIHFRKTYPKAKIVVLTKNYRSAQTILDESYKLIQYNNPDRLEAVEKIDKRLISQRKNHEAKTQLLHASRVENEAENVVGKIIELSSEGYEYSDFAILVRANNHAEPFIRALSRGGIPYQFLGPGRLFRQSEVVDLISYLRVLYNYEDSISLYRLLSLPFFEIEPREISRMGVWAKRNNVSLFEALERREEVDTTDETKEKVGDLVAIIKRHMGLVHKETAGQILYYFLEDTGLITELLNPETAEVEKRAANISKFFDKLKTYEVDHEDATVPAVVDWIELSSELGESPLSADTDWAAVNAVNILTIHSAKGLEFPVVFLVNLVGQRFPTNERKEQIPIPEDIIKETLPTGDFHIQEERRLFYVGMTRARDRLFFTAADFYGEGKREKKMSPFIFEALGDEVVASENTRSETQLTFMDYAVSKGITEPRLTEKKEPLHIHYLSYSQIDTFKLCPLHYKLRYILNIPSPPAPALSLGSAVHETLKDIYISVQNGEKVDKKMASKLLERNWRKDGYRSRTHEEKMFERAQSILYDYLEAEFDPKNIPLLVEKPFTVPITSKNRVNNFLRIGGKIDRVDKKAGNGIEIIDYKTGAHVPTQKEADKNLQLTFYALAASKLTEEPFGKRPEEVLLTLHYIEEGEKVTTRRTADELNKAIEEIFDIREEIEKSDFLCSGHMFCDNCEYSMFCRAQN